ncbi:MAG: MFS transporter [Pseudonocardiaceae bacterium]|nr:MFS transporter [Pseudonocardiaceae bacterium]
MPREVWALVAVSFVIAIGFGIVAPALPTFARSFDVSITAVSVLISAFAFMRLAFAPASGRLVSRLGERPVYITGILLVGVSTVACGFAASYWQLLVFRTLGGIGSTMFTVSAIALLVRMTPPALRGRSTGLWATSFLLGSVTGPLVGGGLIGLSLRAPFLVYGVALFVAALVGWLALRNSTLADREQDSDIVPLTVRAAVRNGAYRAALVSNFTNGWAVFGVRISLVPLFVTEVLRQQEGLAGVALSVFAAGNVAVLMIAGRIADTIGRRPPMIVGLLVAAGGTIWLGFTSGVTAFLVASLVSGLGSGMLTPPQSAAVADVIGVRGKGGPVLAAFQMAADIGAILGPLVAGVLADQLSFSAAFGVTGAIAAVAALFWLRAPETLPRRADDPEPEHTGADIAAECGCIDEGPEVPTRKRMAGRPRHPEA